jgi:hypothetical protein
MQKKIFILGLLLFVILQVKSQDFFSAPDFSQIARNVKTASSSYYYPNLMRMYLTGTTQMTQEEGRHLYFGYIYQPGYVPTDTSEFNSKLVSILSKQSFTQEDFANILQYAAALLEEDPFNLRALNAQLLVYAQDNNTEEYKKVALKRRIVQDAIISTGDGMSEKTPYYVIKVAHEYDILPFLGFNFGGEDKILKGNKVNYLSLSENRFGVEKVYFNISIIMEHLKVKGGNKL